MLHSFLEIPWEPIATAASLTWVKRDGFSESVRAGVACCRGRWSTHSGNRFASMERLDDLRVNLRLSQEATREEAIFMNKILYLAASAILMACASGSPAQSPDHAAIARTHLDPALEWGPCPEFMPEGCAIAVLQGDPAQENADVFFKVPAGASIPRHWHTSPERMVLVSGDLQVTYDGQDAVQMRPGTYTYGPAKLPHEASCRGTEPCVLAIAFVLPVDAFAGEPGQPEDK